VDVSLQALGRGTGVISLVLLTVAIVLGIAARFRRRRVLLIPRYSLLANHRNVSLLASAFVIVHVLAIVAGPYGQLRVVDIFVPFVAARAPIWLGLGTVGVDLLIAVMITSVLRRWLGTRVFRAVHWFVYAMWPVAFLHGIGEGPDSWMAWYLVLSVLCAAAVVGMVCWRLARGYGESRRARARRASVGG
jgi:sulfoxide reductase heme-binding subunit YedZ